MTVARAVAQGLADAGADIEVIPLELGTMLARLNAGDFEMAILSFPEFTEPNVSSRTVLQGLVHAAGRAYNREHRLGPCVLDALLDRGDRSSSDVAERKTIYAEV